MSCAPLLEFAMTRVILDVGLILADDCSPLVCFWWWVLVLLLLAVVAVMIRMLCICR